MSKRETSQITSDLNTRIRTNQLFGDNDLDQWLLKTLDPGPGETILDAGCGTGNHIIKFAARTRTDDSCTGFDVSQSSIQEAQRKAGENGVRVRLLLGDMDDLDPGLIRDESFDTVLSVYAIYYARDVKKALAALARKLKPAGRMAVMGPHGDNNKGWFDFLSQFMKLPENIEKISARFMEEEVVPFARENFAQVDTYEFVNNIHIPSYEDLRNYWTSNVYYKEALNPEFERHAGEHFANRGSFIFFKKGLLVLMKNRRDQGRPAR